MIARPQLVLQQVDGEDGEGQPHKEAQCRDAEGSGQRVDDGVDGRAQARDAPHGAQNPAHTQRAQPLDRGEVVRAEDWEVLLRGDLRDAVCQAAPTVRSECRVMKFNASPKWIAR